jgi:hypothetical protein
MHWMKKGFVFALPILLTLSLSAQVRIKGRIVDRFLNEPLEYAIVTAGEQGRAVITDQQGKFELLIPADTRTLHVSLVGYTAISVPILPTDQPILINMDRGVVDLRAVTLTPQSNQGSFHSLSGIDLNLRPLNSAQDLMRLVPGLFLGQHQGGGLAEHIFLRGFDADHGTDVNISVDEMPVNLVSQIHGQGFSDLHFLIPELVKSYEFGKGPYYAEHGDFTTAGFVAFHTYDDLPKNMVKSEAGDFHTARLMAMVNLLTEPARKKGETAYLAAEGAYTDGPFAAPQRFDRMNIFGKYTRRLGTKIRLQLTLSRFQSQWHSTGEIPERAVSEGLIDRFGFIDSAQGGQTSRSLAILRMTSSLSENAFLENQLYLSKYKFNLNYDDTFFADDSVHGDQLRQRESRNLAGYTGRLVSHRYFSNGTDLISSLGAGWQLNGIHNSELSHTLHQTTVLDYLELGNLTENLLNGYLDENFHTGRWLLNAGARWDYFYFDYHNRRGNSPNPRTKALLSPKLNIEYTVSSHLQFYFKTGRGFHSNDTRVVVRNQGFQVLPSAFGLDIGMNWKPLPNLYLNAALWYLFLQQEFVYNADEGTLDPGDQTRREGLDFSARFQIWSWLFLHLDLDFAKARDVQAPKGENFLPLAVPFSSSGGLDLKFMKRFNAAIRYRYMSDRPATANNSLVAEGYFVTDLNANYSLGRYQAGIEIQNLLNTRWREAQFEVKSRLRGEVAPVDDINFTAGTPFFAKLKFAVIF